MVMMLLGLALFVAVHVLASLRGMRARLVGELGTRGYRGFFSLVAGSGLVLVIYGYALWRAAGAEAVWAPPAGLRGVAMGLMLLACLAAVAAVVPSRLGRWLGAPLPTAVALWAVAHLLVRGDAASTTLFAVLAAWAFYDALATRRRRVVEAPTSTAPAGWGGDMMVVGGALVLYGALAYLFHPYVVGLPLV